MANIATAVLFSAGLDSAVLVADEARRGRVHPLYVSVGLAWEHAELATAQRLLAAPAYGVQVSPLQQLRFTMEDVYPPTHWAIRGTPPAYDTPDEDVYLTGRNLVLLAKAGTWCAQHEVSRIVLGPLAGNPFPDARPAFFAAMAEAFSLGLDWMLEIGTPYRDLHKEQVIQRGVQLGVPFALTLSCMRPLELEGASGASGASGAPFRHCGACSKCRERRDAFKAAGVADPTPYAVIASRS
jgi:7-cyano-7-deazaguanine synthase